MLSLIWSGAACVGALLLLVALVYAAKAGNGDREDEHAARLFFTENGHWPDEETPRAPR